MKHYPSTVLVGVIALLVVSLATGQVDPQITEYFSMCEASAAVAIGPKMFVVANDEDNVLRVYSTAKPDQPVQTFDLSPFLKPVPDTAKTDIEGATKVGNTVYWITSHSRKPDDPPAPNRFRLFATEVQVSGDQVTITPVGCPYRGLVTDLAEAPTLKALPLAKAAKIAPEEVGGLNIEGLCATPEGPLLIGFRNPIPEGKALLVPLENPKEVVQGVAAKLGTPILLPLGGLGIRSIEYSEARRTYFIVAGPYGDNGAFKLYQWSGVASDEPKSAENVNFQDLSPEALIVYPGEGENTIQVLSDDGDRTIGEKKCKKAPENKRRFRSVWVSVSKP